MTSRGVIIGQIIDDLSSLSEKIEFRAKLGMLDIHRILENFVRDILKVIFEANDIKNLNDTRSNAPGLDLGSNLIRTGYQVSSKVDSGKINSTFDKINDNFLGTFDKIKFIVIGKKQNNYPSFDSDKVPDTIDFKLDRDVIDFKDLSKLVFDLSIDKLLEIKKIFDKEFLVVQYNLIEPSSEQTYTTELFKSTNFKPAVNGQLFFRDEEDNQEELTKINNEGKLLSNLPLRTRLVLKYIIENGKEDSSTPSQQFECRYYLIPKLKREINLPNKEIEEELNILIDEGFLGIEQRELHGDIHVPEASVYTRFGEWFKYLIADALEKNILDNILLDLNLEVIDKVET